MKISEMIEQLTEFRNLHGDLDCEKWTRPGGRVPQPSPALDYSAILAPRESVPRFASEYRHTCLYQERRGEPVCRL